MWNLSFTACSFVLREKKDKTGNLFLNDDFSEIEEPYKNYSSVLEVIEEFCNIHKTNTVNKEEKRLFKMKVIDKGTDRDLEYMMIEIESGRYGVKSNITDIDTQKVQYQQKESDAPLLKFHLTVLVPKDAGEKKAYKGFMFFQNYGQYGVKTDTVKDLKTLFSEKLNIILWVGNISPQIFVDTMLKKEKINKIIFIKNRPSIDNADNLRFTYGKEVRIIEKIGWSDSFWNKIKGYIAGGKHTLEFENKEYDNLKMNLDCGGRPRTIGINNIENVSIIESLPNDIKDKNGDIDTRRLLSIICLRTKEYMKTVICHK